MIQLMRAGAMAGALALGACAAFDTPHDYNRHRLSEITLPRADSGRADGVFFFDVTVSGEFPDGDPAAEAQRMKWLAEWLEQRRMCPAGHEVIGKRAFEYLEHNPAHRDLRYEVRCRG
jgi:hypothetical protein